jgi:hypothetical protein
MTGFELFPPVVSLLKSVAGFLPFLFSKITRSSLKIERAPKNILQIVQVNGSLQRVVHHFGPPHKIGSLNCGIERKIRFFHEYAQEHFSNERFGAFENFSNGETVQFCWEFSDLLLVVLSSDQMKIDVVNCLLIGSKASTFKIYPYSNSQPILGKDSLSKISQNFDIEVTIDCSSKHYSKYACASPTTVNGDHYYIYGNNDIYSHKTPESRYLRFLSYLMKPLIFSDSKFAMAFRQHEEKRKKNEPINWIIISDKKIDWVYFDWWHFV